MHTKILILFLTLLSNLNFLVADDPIVELPNGQIRGREATTLEDKTFYIFEGVPYAAPPVGDLRFQPPQPAPSWDDILDTQHTSNICYQTNDATYDNESEDCLFINIYTPQLPSEENNASLPVMFYIHGGGFVEGSNDFFTGDLYVNNDVILTSINYRLGIFGFISTQDEVIPGNNGLKDQAFALQWVHDNIHLFGGDPNQVTIFGQSSGSASAAYQLLNQNNEGLFQGAILGSGSFLSPWAFQRDARQINFATAALLNSSFEDSDDSQDLLDFLLTVDAADLDAAAMQQRTKLWQSGYQYLEISQGYYWGPVVEVKNSDAFITKKMFGLLQAGNILPVPTLIGMTSEEDLIFNTDETSFTYMLQAYDQSPELVVPNDMQIQDQADKVEMGEAIKNIYTGGDPWAENLGDGMRFSSDTSFTRSVMKHADLFSKIADTYFYVFSYDGELPGRDTHYEGAESVSHGEEISYMFCAGTNCDISGYPESDQTTRERLIKIWTDFAKYQNPTPELSELLQNITWPALSTDEGDFYYVDIGENLEIKNHPKDTYEQWNELYDGLDFSDFDTY